MKSVLDIIFPKKCIDCGKITESWICDKCFKDIQYGKIEEYRKGEIKYLISLFSYDEIREKMLKFKFNDEAYIKNYFIELIAKSEKIKNKLKDVDIIIPVPMYWIKKLRRGYNQSELIACGIARMLNIQIDNKILIKYKNTKTQSLLKLEDRKKNLESCFKIKRLEKIENKNILLVDDIYTTGTTINECVRKLKMCKVKSIGIFVLCKR